MTDLRIGLPGDFCIGQVSNLFVGQVVMYSSLIFLSLLFGRQSLALLFVVQCFE
jgi:hypothetical protein